jgi:hypothetical protein
MSAARSLTLGCNDPSAGRRVSLLVPSGVLHASYAVPRQGWRLPLPATLSGWPAKVPAPGEYSYQRGSSVCFQLGWEVVSDVVDGDTLAVLFDQHGPTWQPSDRGTGGFTIHRPLDKSARMRLILVETKATLLLPIDAPVSARLALLDMSKGEVRRA